MRFRSAYGLAASDARIAEEKAAYAKRVEETEKSREGTLRGELYAKYAEVGEKVSVKNVPFIPEALTRRMVGNPFARDVMSAYDSIHSALRTKNIIDDRLLHASRRFSKDAGAEKAAIENADDISLSFRYLKDYADQYGLQNEVRALVADYSEGRYGKRVDIDALYQKFGIA